MTRVPVHDSKESTTHCNRMYSSVIQTSSIVDSFIKSKSKHDYKSITTLIFDRLFENLIEFNPNPRIIFLTSLLVMAFFFRDPVLLLIHRSIIVFVCLTFCYWDPYSIDDCWISRTFLYCSESFHVHDQLVVENHRLTTVLNLFVMHDRSNGSLLSLLLIINDHWLHFLKVIIHLSILESNSFSIISLKLNLNLTFWFIIEYRIDDTTSDAAATNTTFDIFLLILITSKYFTRSIHCVSHFNNEKNNRRESHWHSSFDDSKNKSVNKYFLFLI